MTQEEKYLILNVCYASLLYGITVYVEHDTFYDEREPYKTKISIKSHQILDDFANNSLSSKLLVRPYLRPMSSMTEDEMGDYAKFKLSYDDVYKFTDFRTTGKGFINVHTSCKNGGVGYTFQVNNRTMLYDGVIGIDWLNAHHFDYRGLIKKGLALPAPEGMYNE